MINLDEQDHALIRLLRRNARMATAELARRCGMSRTTAQARIDRMERDGVISGYTVLTVETYAPGAIRATVLLQLEPQATSSTVAALRKMREVESASTTAGRFDMAAMLVAPDTARLDAALDRVGALPGVRGMESLIHLTSKLERRG